MMLARRVGRSEAAALLVVLSVLVLLPIGRTSELGIVIGAVVGLVLLLRHRFSPLADPGLRLVLLLFAGYWLPILLSGFVSVVPQKTWMTALETLRFLPFALFVAWALRRSSSWPPFMLAIAAVATLWLIDAWVQFLSGNSLGGAPELERLAGIFGADNLKLGPVLVVLSPFVLLVARERAGRVGLLLAYVLVLVPVLLAGSRAAWLSYALVSVVFAWRETKSLRRFLPLLLGIVLGIALSVGSVWKASEGFDARMERSLLVLQGTEHAFDEASAGRVRIWSAAIAMFQAHPLAGVGVRGFRHAYADYSEAGDPFVDPVSRIGASHAHQIVLEILSETGLLGLLLWLGALTLALRAWWQADATQRARAFAPGLALVAMCFPLNTHFAFYSAWWGLLFWWLLAIYCAALAVPAQKTQGEAADDGRRQDQNRP
ncbi:O-antigen ligase family protein [Dokdonella sp.]|uniref:O-antigen ligase family protein n=1 Tax=Dokdonella sp. TaxID=2291710 RepID=UPI003C4C27E2